MAEYKVPQDVEADDKLLGPFTFRQFIYLVIAAALVGLAVILFRIAIPLCILPVPLIIFLVILALPIKKDQPMETYIRAVVDYHLKPHTRIWTAGQPEKTIEITAPKQVEVDRTNGLSQEEASHRLSFLADLIDTEGYSIKGGSTPNSALHDDIYAEAQDTRDIFDTPQNPQLDLAIQSSTDAHHQQIADQMRNALKNANATPAPATNYTAPSYYEAPENYTASDTSLAAAGLVDEYVEKTEEPEPVAPSPTEQSAVVVAADIPVEAVEVKEDKPNNPYAIPTAAEQTETEKPATEKPNRNASSIARNAANEALKKAGIGVNVEDSNAIRAEEAAKTESESQKSKPAESPATTSEPASVEEPDEDFVNLANNTDFSIETIAKQANRIKENQSQSSGEVYISLH